MLVRHQISLGWGPRPAEHEQTRLVRREEQLDRGGVHLVRLRYLGEVVLGVQAEAGAHVAELDIEIERRNSAGELLREGDGKVGRDGGLAGATLGRHHDEDLAGLRGGRGSCPLVLALTETGIQPDARRPRSGAPEGVMLSPLMTAAPHAPARCGRIRPRRRTCPDRR
jgi:hypothetical protein